MIKLTGHPTQFTLAGKDRVRERVFFFDYFFSKMTIHVFKSLRHENSLRGKFAIPVIPVLP